MIEALTPGDEGGGGAQLEPPVDTVVHAPGPTPMATEPLPAPTLAPNSTWATGVGGGTELGGGGGGGGA